MLQPPEIIKKYCFGVFELDSATGELRKRGIRIRLQEQPYRILKLLLENAGEVVTRETLCALLWPKDTFVEFERSLNAAVSKLRQALGDSAENPRFVETVAKQGYRFVAPVGFGAALEKEQVGFRIASHAEDFARAISQAELVPNTARKTHKLFWLTAVGLLSVALGFGISFLMKRSSRAGKVPGMTRLTFDAGLATDPVASSDGRLLAYASDRGADGYLQIWVQQFIPDGQAVQLTRGDFDNHQPAFSPDGNKIVFRSERDGGGLYVIPTLGGEPMLLAPQGRDPRFSPDGRWIAFWKGIMYEPSYAANAGTLSVIPSTGGAAFDVPSDLSEAGVPEWSPDGRHLIVFGENKNGKKAPLGSDWWVVPVAGGLAMPTGGYPLLEKEGFVTGIEEPRVTSWRANELIFTARRGDNIDAWSIPIRSSNFRVAGQIRQLTSEIGMNLHPSVLAHERLLFANLTRATDIWGIPVDTNKVRPLGKPYRVTDATGVQEFPSLSMDGKLLAYSSLRYGHRRMWIKDLASGVEKEATDFKGSSAMGELSADGRQLYCVVGKDRFSNYEGGSGFMVPLGGGPMQPFCTDCMKTWDVSHDNQAVIYRKHDGSARLFNRVTRQDRLFMQSPKYELFQPKFSPDRRWIALEAVERSTSRLFVTALGPGDQMPPEKDWILITEDENWADKPRWSPDGNSLYFISNRDGFFCIWAQRLDPSTKKPSGEPIAVSHFHTTRFSASSIAAVDLSVARDKVAIDLSELKGNLWATSLPR